MYLLHLLEISANIINSIYFVYIQDERNAYRVCDIAKEKNLYNSFADGFSCFNVCKLTTKCVRNYICILFI